MARTTIAGVPGSADLDAEFVRTNAAAFVCLFVRFVLVANASERAAVLFSDVHLKDSDVRRGDFRAGQALGVTQKCFEAPGKHGQLTRDLFRVSFYACVHSLPWPCFLLSPFSERKVPVNTEPFILGRPTYSARILARISSFLAILL